MSDSYDCDIIIVGGGIVGLATAFVLSRFPGVRLAVIEAEQTIAAHQTGNNSGVIHSGLYYRPGSLKATNCVNGRRLLLEFCQQHHIDYEQCGKLVVATHRDELPALNELERRGRLNGLSGIKRLNQSQLNEYEPHVAGIDGLLVPETGIVDFVAVAKKLAELLKKTGHQVHTQQAFKGLQRRSNGLIIRTTQGELKAKYLINCAGLQSDRVARSCGLRSNLRIVPFRGEYYQLKPEKRYLVRNLIYPVPDSKFPFLGVHFTRMVNGKVEAGPNAVLAFRREGYRKADFSAKDTFETFSFPGFWHLAAKYWRTGIGEFYRSFRKGAFVKALQKLMPAITASDLTDGGAGVRAQALTADGKLIDDFHILQHPQMIHVLNAPSPAATASLSIGETIAALAKKNFNLIPT